MKHIAYTVLILTLFSVCAFQYVPVPFTTGTGGGPTTYSVDTTGLTGNVSAANVPGLSSISGAGFYCATGYEVVSTSGTSSILPQINFIFTDNDSNTVETQNIAPTTGAPTTQAAGTFNGTYNGTTSGINPMCGYAKSGTAIQYSTSGCTGACGVTMVYALHLRVVGPITTNAVDTTGLTADIGTTNVPGLASLASAGFYCARSYFVITTGVATSAALPSLIISYTDADTNTAETTNINGALVSSPLAGVTGGTYNDSSINQFCFYAKSGTAIQYGTTTYYSNPAGMTYSLHLRVVGPITTNAVDTTGLTADIGTTNVPGLASLASAGFYCVLGYEVITTPAATTSTLSYISVAFTDSDSNTSELYFMNSTSGANTTGFAVGTVHSDPFNPICFYAKGGTAVQYATDGYASNPASAMTFAFHLRVVGPGQF